MSADNANYNLSAKGVKNTGRVGVKRCKSAIFVCRSKSYMLC